jgi:hypothetical protein
MAFSNTETKVEFEIDGKIVTNTKEIFSYMNKNNISTLGLINITDQDSDPYVKDTPDDDEFVGISSLSSYNALNPSELAFDSSTFVGSSGITGGNGKESNYIAPPSGP